MNMVRMAAGLISYYLTDSEVTQAAQVLFKQVLDEVRTELVPVCGVEPLTGRREAAAAATGPNSMGMLRRERGPFLPGDQTRENPPPHTHTPTCNASVSHLPLYRRPSGEGNGGGRGFKKQNKKHPIRQQQLPPDIIFLPN